MHTPAHAPARSTASSAQSDPSAVVPLLDPKVRLLSPSDPLWFFVAFFLVALAVAELVLPFPVTNLALCDMCCALTSLINGLITIPLSTKITFERYSRYLKAKQSANKTSVEVQADFYNSLNNDSMRFVLRWANALMIAQGIYLYIRWNPLFFAHHVLSLLAGIPALVLSRGGAFPTATLFAGEITNPFSQVCTTLRSLPLILTDTTHVDYIARIEKEFALPLFLIMFVFFRFILLPPFYVDLLSYCYRRLHASSQHRKTAMDKRAADEHAYEHPDETKTGEPQIPLGALATWVLAPAVVLLASAQFAFEKREYLVLPDPSVLFGS